MEEGTLPSASSSSERRSSESLVDGLDRLLGERDQEQLSLDLHGLINLKERDEWQ